MGAEPKALAERVYGEAEAAARDAARWPDLSSATVQGRLAEAAAGLFGVLSSSSVASLMLLTCRSGAGTYLYVHSVNVSILAMRVALGLGCQPERVKALGAAALVLDMRRAASLGISPATEAGEVRLHPFDGDRVFEHQAELEAALPESLRELLPARKGGKADPQRRRPSHHGAHILAICDLYESLSHPRPWRQGRIPHDALLSMLKRHRRDTDETMIKAFTENLSLYPPGSYVELSTKELGRVVETHKDEPERPTVELLARSDGRPLEAPRMVRLLDEPQVQILRPLDESRLPLKDLRQRLAVAATRWWMPPSA